MNQDELAYALFALNALVFCGATVSAFFSHDADEKLECSARNLPNTSVLRVAGLNVYDVLRHEKLLLTKPAVAAIEARLGSAPAGGAAS